MAIIKPTIGRVVWYWPSHLAHTSQPYAALIAHVHNDTDINVGYFDHLGVAGSEQHVALLHDDDSYGNPGDVVFSPFTGIGSEGFVSVKMGRRFVGSELKPSYYEQACRNLGQAKAEQSWLFA